MPSYPLNPLGAQPPLDEVSIGTAAWILQVSRKVVRSRLDQFVRPDGAPGYRLKGGKFVIFADALRAYCESAGGDEVQLMLLDRIVKRTALAPKVEPTGPPPAWSQVIFELPSAQGSR